MKVKITLKPGVQPIQQKARPIPVHLQEAVYKEIVKLQKEGHIEKLEKVPENTFISPAVITVKKDKTVKLALDSRKLNDSCIKRRSQMPNMEDLLNRISAKISQDENKELWISKIDLEYAYGQLELDEETSKHCVFSLIGGKLNGYYKFKKGFYGLAEIPTIFQEKIERTLNCMTPAWLDDIIVTTRGTKAEHIKELEKVLEKLENGGYRASIKKTEIGLKETVWIGHHISKDGIKPNNEKTDAISKLNPPKTPKELKSFLGAVQYFAKFTENLSKMTDGLRRLLKKDTPWNWNTDRQKEFETLKQKIINLPCLAHYSVERENIITTDACNTGLGGTLWQKQKDGELKPIAYASRFLNDTEKKYAVGELELLGVVWALEHFRYYIYGKPVKLYTDHQSLQPLLRKNRVNKIYSARLTRWLDRLSHFDVKVQHISGNEIKLTDYLSRHPYMEADTDTPFDEEYVINAIAPLYEFSKQANRMTLNKVCIQNGREVANMNGSHLPHDSGTDKIGKISEQIKSTANELKLTPLSASEFKQKKVTWKKWTMKITIIGAPRNKL